MNKIQTLKDYDYYDIKILKIYINLIKIFNL